MELATQRGKDAAGSAHLRVHVGKLVGHCLALGVAYLATMSPWLYRNWVDLGIPLHNPGLNTMFLREYSDMFTYGAQIDLSHYLSLGWDAIVRSKLQAGLRHLQIVAEALSYLLVPLAALGVWLLRRNRRALPFIAYLAALYVAMAFAFSLPGQFGSLLHSLAALLPFLMATVAVGLDAGIDALARRRPHLSPTTLKLVLTGVVVGAQIALTLGLASIAARTWESRYSFALYPQAAEWLDARLAPGEPVLILDPPAFAYFGARPAVVVPNNDLDTLVSIARRYAARYLVLEPAHMPAVKPLYRGDESHAALTPRVEIRNDRGQELKIYEVE